MAEEKPSSRRDFLWGRSAGRALIEAVRTLADQTLPRMEHHTSGSGTTRPAIHRPSVAHLHASRRAMACEFAIQYHAEDGGNAAEAAVAALDLIDVLEDQLSIYRPHTEVSQINRVAAAHPTTVEPRLFTLLQLCAWLHASTGGAFDITTGPLSRTWGFLKREGRLPSEDEIAVALANVGFGLVGLDHDRRTIRFAKPEVEINFNAIGKGYALDRVAELLAGRGVDDYLCHGGSSSVLARGRDRAGDVNGWAVGVPHPHRLERSLGDIVLRDEALGTSGAGTQFFMAEGRRYGHLLDPRTGRPTEGVYTATAVAATAAEADALATAFYILGPAGTSEYCASHPEAAAVLVCERDGVPEAFDVHTFNLNNGRWLPAGE